MKLKLKKVLYRMINRPYYDYPNHPYIGHSVIEKPDLVSVHAFVQNSMISGSVRIGDFTKVIDARISGDVSLGRWTSFLGPNSFIYTKLNTVKIGNFCSIARNVSIQEYDHKFDRLTSYFIHTNVFGEKLGDDIVSKGDVVIGNDVWIGTQSVILSGAVISDGAVIGANSVVNSFIPPYAIAVGSPAKVVKYRFPEKMIESILALQWWNWDKDEIRKNRFLFDGPFTEETLEQFLRENQRPAAVE